MQYDIVEFDESDTVSIAITETHDWVCSVVGSGRSRRGYSWIAMRRGVTDLDDPPCTAFRCPESGVRGTHVQFNGDGDWYIAPICPAHNRPSLLHAGHLRGVGYPSRRTRVDAVGCDCTADGRSESLRSSRRPGSNQLSTGSGPRPRSHSVDTIHIEQRRRCRQ